MDMNKVFETALQIAVRAHAGQKDKLGKPYILHPLAVAAQLNSLELKTVALLHDVLEDTETTEKDLLEQGIPLELVNAVVVLTRPKGVTYEEYLDKVKNNQLALAVKKADLAHNTSADRAKGLNAHRKAKYDLAKRILLNSEELEAIQKKATLYDKMIEDRRRGAKKTNMVPSNERKERAKKAALARWGK